MWPSLMRWLLVTSGQIRRQLYVLSFQRLKSMTLHDNIRSEITAILDDEEWPPLEDDTEEEDLDIEEHFARLMQVYGLEKARDDHEWIAVILVVVAFGIILLTIAYVVIR